MFSRIRLKKKPLPANNKRKRAQLCCARLLKIERMTKYNNIKYKGYDSKKEYRRAQELELLQEKGIISELQKQVRFELIPSQREQPITRKSKVLERSVSYVADFQYLRESDGALVVEDAKGMRTKEYIIKRKLMLYIHGIKINEV